MKNDELMNKIRMLDSTNLEYEIKHENQEEENIYLMNDIEYLNENQKILLDKLKNLELELELELKMKLKLNKSLENNEILIEKCNTNTNTMDTIKCMHKVDIDCTRNMISIGVNTINSEITNTTNINDTSNTNTSTNTLSTNKSNMNPMHTTTTTTTTTTSTSNNSNTNTNRCCILM